MFDYCKELQKAAQVLDKFDLSEWIEEFCENGESRDMNDFMDFLFDKDNDKIIHAIDKFDANDFSTYMSQTYSVWIQERNIYEMYRKQGAIHKTR